MTDLWTYPIAEWHGETLIGWEVAARDGRLGTVVEATYHVGGSYLIVASDGSNGAGTVLLPAGLVDRIDRPRRRIVVNRTRGEIARAPEYNGSPFSNLNHRAALAVYYGSEDGERPTGPFRYTLMTPSGRVIAQHEVSVALQPDEVVDLGGANARWRVFTVLGSMVTVVHERAPRMADAP